MTEAPHEPTASVCPQCGTHVAPALLACPSCQRLVHADELKRLAAEAERSRQAGDPSGALAAWRQALDLLPRDTTQHQAVSARIVALSRTVDGEPVAGKPGSRWGKGAAGLGAIGALLAKRSEEHTSELQSPDHLVCRLLLEKKKLIIKQKSFNNDINTNKNNILCNITYY